MLRSRFTQDTHLTESTVTTPTIDFGSLTNEEIAQRALKRGKTTFELDRADGLVTGDSLAMVIGMRIHGKWCELGRQEIGTDAAQFVPNIDYATGKLATALNYQLDSVDALSVFEDEIPEGAQQYTGGVFYVARVKTRDCGWMQREFAAAASGVQGEFDANAAAAAVRFAGTLWVSKMQALYGKYVKD